MSKSIQQHIDEAKTTIWHYTAPKFLYQYRKDRDLAQRFKSELASMLRDFSVNIENSVQKKYKNYIPKPKGTLLNRLKFLFLGRF